MNCLLVALKTNINKNITLEYTVIRFSNLRTFFTYSTHSGGLENTLLCSYYHMSNSSLTYTKRCIAIFVLLF